MVKEAKLWQEQAESDFEDAKLLWDNHRYGAAVLFYQQSVEKLIKAYIVSHKNLAPKKTHRIEDLLKEADLNVVHIEETTGIKIEELSKAYIRVRYPDLNKQYFRSRDKATKFVILGEQLYIWIKKQFRKR